MSLWHPSPMEPNQYCSLLTANPLRRVLWTCGEAFGFTECRQQAHSTIGLCGPYHVGLRLKTFLLHDSLFHFFSGLSKENKDEVPEPPRFENVLTHATVAIKGIGISLVDGKVSCRLMDFFLPPPASLPPPTENCARALLTSCITFSFFSSLSHSPERLHI